MEEKKRPSKSLRREMVCIVTVDLLSKETRPGRGKLWRVAKEIVEKYPCSFQDRSGKNAIGTGYDSLLVQMEN
ncbi:hypothetical protein J4Q44_G00283730 [Coregonus suidteri]|uniref:Uncharacterized protein n=1 Tax=Coregonus suidteri TaxID=861788 RepID=A0AAN8QCR6_9TELE